MRLLAGSREFVHGGSDDEPSDSLAGADDFVPTLWATLFVDDEVEVPIPSGRFQSMASCRTDEGVQRSRVRIEQLQALLPNEFGSLAKEWLEFIDGFDQEWVGIVVATSERKPSRKMRYRLDVRRILRDVDALDGDNLLKELQSNGSDPRARRGAKQTSPDIALATCGYPCFRPVPWTIQFIRHATPNIARAPRAPTSAAAASELPVLNLGAPVAGRDVRDVNPIARPGTWLVSPVLLGLWAWACIAEGPIWRGSRPTRLTDALLVVLRIGVAFVLCARHWWAVPSAAVAGSLVLAITIAGYGTSGMIVALFLSLATLAYRGSVISIIVGSAVVFITALATMHLAGDLVWTNLRSLLFIAAIMLTLGGIGRFLAIGGARESELSEGALKASSGPAADRSGPHRRGRR